MDFANRDLVFGASEGLLHWAHSHDKGEPSQGSAGKQYRRDWLLIGNSQYLNI